MCLSATASENLKKYNLNYKYKKYCVIQSFTDGLTDRYIVDYHYIDKKNLHSKISRVSIKAAE